MAIQIYWVVYANGAGKPSNDQIRLGQNSSGAAALKSGSATYTAGGTLTFPPAITGLTANTPYQEAFVAYDDVALTYNTSVESAAITTLAATITGTSTGTFTLSGASTGALGITGTSTDAFTLTGVSTGTIAQATTSGTSTGTFTLTGVSTGLIAQATTSGTSTGTFTLTGTATGTIVAGGVVDPPWANVVTLLHNDGAGVNFVDSSQYNWTITNVSATHGTPAKFGDAAQLFPGYFSIDGTNPAFAFGTDDLTVELQIYKATVGRGFFIGWTGPGGDFRLGLNSSFNDLDFSLPGGGSGRTVTTLTNSAYTWIVVTRAAGRWTIWQNLAQVWTDASGPASSSTPSGPMYYGRDATGNSIAGGLLDEVRITKGLALYTQANPPTTLPTAPYPDGGPITGISGLSTGVFTLTGTATGTIAVVADTGNSFGTFTLTGTSTGKLGLSATSTGTFTLAGTSTGTISRSMTGTSDVLFTLTGLSTGIIGDGGLCPGLPPGWVMTKVLETVPNPNGPNFALPYFVRWTYITTDENGQFVCASGADTDCCAQAHAMAEQRTQKRPYNEAI
jgi:hypothetical protein